MVRRQGEEREGGVVVLLLVLGLLALAGIGYVAAAVVAGNNVPRGTSVAGVDIGGRSPEEAKRVLSAELSERLGEPFTVTVGDVTQQITPDEAGISVDYPATMARAGGGRTFNPKRLWDYYDGGEDLDPVLRVDQTLMTTALEVLNASTGTRAQDGAISFASGRAEVVEPSPGAAVDTALAPGLIVEALARGDEQVALPLSITEPLVDSADVQAAVRDFANPALSGPVTLVFKESEAKLAPRDYARLLRARVQDGALAPDVRTAELAGLVGLTTRDAESVDASIALTDGAPRVVRSRAGATYGPQDVREAFLDAVVQSGEGRTVRVEGTRVAPSFSTAKARKLRVREQVSASTVPVTAVDVDLQNAVQQLDGTLLKPGDTFSLNDAAGEAGASATQLATAAYGAGYAAGLEIVDRTGPTQRVDGAPLGREATVSFGSVDLRWRNDTKFGVLVQAVVSPGSVTVALWSTPVREVSTSIGDRRNVTAPTTVTGTGPDCVPSPGAEGFEIDVTRVVRNLGGDEVVHSDTAHTAYLPIDKVVCKPPEEPSKPPRGVRD